MSIIPKFIKKTQPYRFASWLYGSFRREQQKIYSPEQFREYGSDVLIESDVYINMPDRIVLKDRVVIYAGNHIKYSGGLPVGGN